jgi:hypothetical protein
METLKILDAVQTLPANQKMLIAEKIIASLRKETRKERLNRAVESNYPDGFFKLFGAIEDDTFVEPENIEAEYDIHREPL